MMQYQVLIQNLTDRLFTASVVGLPEVRSNGTTEEEAMNQTDPWLSNMGLFQYDPTFDNFLAEVETYRSEVDATECVDLAQWNWPDPQSERF